MKSHHYLWSVVTLIIISLLVSSVSAAPAVANDALDTTTVSPEQMYPVGSEVNLEDLNTQLKSFDFNAALQQLPPNAEVNEISSDKVRWDVSLEELETNTAAYPDGYYGVSMNKEDQSAIIANLKTITIDGESAREIEFGFAPTCDASAVVIPVIVAVGCITLIIFMAVDGLYHVYSHSLTSQYFKDFTRHTIRRGGYQYLSHELCVETLWDYLNDEAPLLADYPEGATIVLNLKGHGYLNNNEVIAQSYSSEQNDPSLVFVYAKDGVFVYANRDKCGDLLGEWRQLKWIGVYLPNSPSGGQWYDVVWGSSYIFQQ